MQTLKTRIRDFKNKKSKITEEHKITLADTISRLNTTERTTLEMEKTRWTMESLELDL
jgi:hypothetical protein